MLENPVWAALSGPQACYAEASGDAACYQPDISPFGALAEPADPAGWCDLAALTDDVLLTGPSLTPGPGWEVAMSLPGVQMIGQSMTGVEDTEAVLLSETDVPEILDLVERAKPGPFRKRTIALGRYLGIRIDGKLVAMAGERFRLPGWTEISAVATDPDYQGRGLGARLTLAVAAGILGRGELPFLHAAADNDRALRLYERLGFEPSHDVIFAQFRQVG